MLIEAKDVGEAITIAEEFKLEGRYRWFRGQIRNWTLISSLNRHSDHASELRRIKHFLAWVKGTKGLEHLAAHLDSAIAVAQHHGLPTHFIDFTTEPRVAGYFASEGVETQVAKPFDLDAEQRRFYGGLPAREDIGVILCLDQDALMDTWRAVSAMLPPEAAPEFLELDVPDLWRLEAQHGAFLYCPAVGFEEKVFDLDRIVFPHTGQVREPPPELIYPTRKSHLESLLDQYFQVDLIARHPLKSMLPAGLFPNTVTIEPPWDSTDERYLSKGPVTPHPSWAGSDFDAFLRPGHERFHEVRASTPVTLELPSGTSKDAAAAVRAQVLALLRTRAGVREQLARWTLANAEPSRRRDLEQAVTAAFDALRLLPVTDEEMAAAIGNGVGLLLSAGASQTLFAADARSAFAAFFGSTAIDVEMAMGNGAYARAMIATDRFHAALRGDLTTFLNEDGRTYYAEHPDRLLTDIGAPNCLFPLAAFRSLFYEQVVPTQVAFRPDSPLEASFARVERFGLP